jgi:hypothetical protein
MNIQEIEGCGTPSLTRPMKVQAKLMVCQRVTLYTYYTHTSKKCDLLIFNSGVISNARVYAKLVEVQHQVLHLTRLVTQALTSSSRTNVTADSIEPASVPDAMRSNLPMKSMNNLFQVEKCLKDIACRNQLVLIYWLHLLCSIL